MINFNSYYYNYNITTTRHSNFEVTINIIYNISINTKVVQYSIKILLDYFWIDF